MSLLFFLKARSASLWAHIPFAFLGPLVQYPCKKKCRSMGEEPHNPHVNLREAKRTSRAPRSARSKAGGNPVWEGLASHPVSSLGTEAVTPGLSVGRKGSRPKAQAEDKEPRNHQWERSMHGTSRRQYCS
jgi:hypothetical protein